MEPIPADPIVDDHKKSEEVRTARIFYWILTVAIGGLFGVSLVTDPTLEKISEVVLPSCLVALHLGLYWLSLFGLRKYRERVRSDSSNPRWLIPYLLLQTILITAILHLINNQWPILILYLVLAGHAVGMIGYSINSVIVAGGIVIVAIVNYGLINDFSNILGFLSYLLPITFFMIAYIVLYGREAQSKNEAIRLLRELEIAHKQLGEYSDQVEDLTLSAERQRMARELHDTLAQGLAGLVLQLEAVDSHLSKGAPGTAQEIVQKAMDRARATLSEARQAIGNLRSGNLSADDLLRSIQNEVDHFTAAAGIPCDVNLQLPENITADQAEYTLLLIGEGLTNAARHAQASRTWLEVQQDEGNLVVKVGDNGVGFDPLEVEKVGGHFGLMGLEESARLAKGRFEIRTKTGQGTELILYLPDEVEQG